MRFATITTRFPAAQLQQRYGDRLANHLPPARAGAIVIDFAVQS